MPARNPPTTGYGMKRAMFPNRNDPEEQERQRGQERHDQGRRPRR